MAQTRIIVDSNSYFRLAQNIHPLLCQPFGAESVTLYVHAELNTEFRRSARLKNKFHWVSEKKYAENRDRSISLSSEQKAQIETTYEYLWEHVKEAFLEPRKKGPSPTDTRIIATAKILDIQVVTDDQDMIELAKEFAVKHISSLGVMKLMLDAGHIDDDKIDMVVEQWLYDNDTPYGNWGKEFKKLFGRAAPTSY